jgi:hypothetical protein
MTASGKLFHATSGWIGENNHTMSQNTIEKDTLAPPPRLLLWIAVVILTLIIIAGIGVVLFILNDRRFAVLLPYGAFVAVVLPIVMIGSAFVMRKSLPRRFWIWLLVIWLVLLTLGAVAGVSAFRETLPPRYQEVVLTYAPFMRQFMRPTPQGGVLPTSAAATSNISPADLLAMPLGATTDVPVAEVTEEATATQQVTLTPTQTPTPAITAPPTLTQAAVENSTLQPTPEPLIANASFSNPPSARMYGFTWEQQDWNNCGPTNITIALSHYGWQEDQDYAASFLRPSDEDKNVSPGELVNFVNTQTGVRAITRIGGDLELLKSLIASNFPVVVETTYTPEGYDWIGHYQTLVGYDDSSRDFFVYDSYLGTGVNGGGIPESYDQFDRDWQAFNRVFIVIYEQEREDLLVQLLGDRADVTLAAENALAVAQEEAREDLQNPFPWFNMGTALVKLGRYEEAAAAYDEAVHLELPFRMNWYQFGMFEAYFNVGRYDDVLGLVQINLTNAGDLVEETRYWEGRVYEALGDYNQAQVSYQRALDQNPQYAAARDALNALPI